LEREIVHIKVGKSLQDYGVHKDLICGISPYFKAAFTSGFQECESGAMKLETIEVEVFDLFYNWLYNQSLGDTGGEKFSSHSQRDLLQLYVFADMIQIPTLKNVALCGAYEVIMLSNTSTGFSLPLDSLVYVWENTVESSPLRQMMLDLCVWNLDGELMFADLWASRCTVPMCLEIMRAMSAKLCSKNYVMDPFVNFTKYLEPVPEQETKASWL
jgi:BTB/POZ domain